jgi:hypothetical protein
MRIVECEMATVVSNQNVTRASERAMRYAREETERIARTKTVPSAK